MQRPSQLLGEEDAEDSELLFGFVSLVRSEVIERSVAAGVTVDWVAGLEELGVAETDKSEAEELTSSFRPLSAER